MDNEIERFEVGDLRVVLWYDEFSGSDSPRDWDNVTHIYGKHRSYKIGDGEPPAQHEEALRRGGINLLHRYLRRFCGCIAFTKLGMLDHSGVSYYTVPLGMKGDHWADPGGWDSGVVGYVYVTRESWEKCCGDSDPFAEVDGKAKFPLGSVPIKQQHVWHLLEAEVDTYSHWANGEVYGYSVIKPHGCGERSCPHDELLEAVGGFIGGDDDELRKEATAVAESYASSQVGKP